MMFKRIEDKMFEFNNGEIISYLGTETSVVIPEEIDGVKVTKIGIRSFANKNIASVTMPSTVKEIGGRAFEDNNLKNVILPKGLQAIGIAAFASNQLSQLEIPASLTNIGHGAFKKNKLTEISIPDSVTYIGEYAFNGNQIKKASILSKEILDIGSFDNSVQITVRKNVNTQTQDSDEAKDYKYENTSNEGCISISEYLGDSKHIVIPAEIDGKRIEAIGNEAFRDKGIESVDIPNTVRFIGHNAFSDNQLSDVTIPNNVEIVNSRAFMNNKLTKVVIPSSLNQVGIFAFANNNLTRVSIPYQIIRKNEFMNYMLSEAFDKAVRLEYT